MAEIPEDLIVEILLLLPVLSLLRFRCVSKRWRNLIDSPDFVKSHLNLSNKVNSVVMFYKKSCTFYADLDPVCNAGAPPKLKGVTIPWHGDVYDSFGSVGVCNGLLCIYRDDCGVVLWNPSTRKHVQIPLPQHLLDEARVFCSWGFGYDCDSDDYKVVTIAYLNDDSCRSVAWVYSLKFGLWKSIGDFSYILLCWRRRAVFVNGALHWSVGPRDGPNSIAALHLGKLQYNMLPLLDFSGMRFRLELHLLDGFFCATSHDRLSHGFDLWVMKEYGVKESWTKLITCGGSTARLTSLAYTGNDDELLVVSECNMIVRYKLKTTLFKSMVQCRPSNCPKPLVYIPSLVCPQSGACAAESCEEL